MKTNNSKGTKKKATTKKVLGRPINPKSAHHKYVQAQLKRVEAGEEIKRGRPVDPKSEHQKRIIDWEARRAKGEIVKRGRPFDPKSLHFKQLIAQIERAEELVPVDIKKVKKALANNAS